MPYIQCRGCKGGDFTLDSTSEGTRIDCANPTCRATVGFIRSEYEPNTEETTRVFWYDPAED
jgi:hypothetical protein